MTSMNTFGLIGLTEENVGIDRRFYTGLTSTNGTFAVSYNAGRVDVFLNGIKLVGNHTGNSNYDYTMDATTGTGSSITLATGVALVSADVVECIGYVSNSSNTVTSYNPTPTSGGGWNVFSSINHTASDLVNVFLNGVLLDDSDYTLDASANTVTIGGATLTASDVVVIQVIGALDYSNFVPAGGGTFSGNVAVTGDLTVDTNTLKVDSSNNKVGIGTSDPKSEQHTEGTALITGSANSFQSEQTSVIFGRHGRTDASTDRRHTISQKFDTASSLSNNQLNFNISATDSGTYTPTKMMTLDGTGDVTIQTGNLVIGTAGKGIDFSNQTGTNNPDANGELLDHFEEGTCTLNFEDSSDVTLAMNSSFQTGSYTRVGNVVTVTGDVRITGKGSSSATSTLRLGGLPFTVKNANSGKAGMSIGVCTGLDSNHYPNDHPSISAFAEAGTTYCIFRINNTANGDTDMAVQTIGGGFVLIFSLTYII